MIEALAWTQPLCRACWPLWMGDNSEPLVVVSDERHPCCHCGVETRSGIWIRVDPESAFCAFPMKVER